MTVVIASGLTRPLQDELVVKETETSTVTINAINRQAVKVSLSLLSTGRNRQLLYCPQTTEKHKG